MAEPWNQWYPHDIDTWQGSGNIQALSDTGYRAVHNIMQDMWKQESCSLQCEDKILRKASRVSDRWEQCREEVMDYFDRMEDGSVTNNVLRGKWQKAKHVYESRQNAAKSTNSSRSPNGHRTVTAPIASRSADTRTLTETTTGTETSAVSKTSSSHPGASLGAVQTLHPDMAIYEKYPRKEGKGAALESIRKAVARLVKGEDPHPPMVKIEAQRYLMRRVLEYERSPVGRQADKTKLPHPATWFNQKRYDDDQANWHQLEAASGTFKGKTGHSVDAAKRAIQEIEDSHAVDGYGDQAAGEAGRAGLPAICERPGEVRADGPGGGGEGHLLEASR